MALLRAIALGAVVLLAVCRSASGQDVPVSDYPSLLLALQNNSVITNFVTNSTISLSTVGQTFQITSNVFINAGTNNVVINGSSLTRLFHVHPGSQLILNNLQLLNGIASSGGAVFNEGTLIVSNCIISGNAATNVNGVNGTANSSGGDGSSGSSGGNALGGAIYSTGAVSVYFSVLGTNSAAGGSGGAGGGGGASPFFGGNGGDGGDGGSASGAAIYSSGSNNVFYADQFIDNQCVAGPAGGGGAAGTGSFDPGDTGGGGTGGPSQGGALCIVNGSVTVDRCLFYLNSTTAGASASGKVSFTGTGSDGNTGGAAVGGGLFISAGADQSDIENTVFFNNSCVGGSGGNATGQSAHGGSGGSAIGGGLDCAIHAIVRSCTLATNTLVGGTNGTGTSGAGSVGGTSGWDLYSSGGGLQLSDSILSGGTNEAPNFRPNAFGVTDAGFNVSSDASMAKKTSSTLINASTGLDSGLASYGGPLVGPGGISGPVMLTLKLLGGPPAQLIPGVAGISYPVGDQIFQARGSPASAGAFESAPLTLSTNFSLPLITSEPVSVTNSIGTSATFTVGVSNGASYGYQWLLNGTNLIDNATFAGATTSNLTVKKVSLANQGPYQVIVGVSILQGVTPSEIADLVVIAPPKITVQPAKKPSVPNGAIVSFKVTATGAEPLAVQWRNGTVDLQDGNEISGATTSNLVINGATSADAGTYSVVIANAYGSVTSVSVPLNIVPDKMRPTVAFTSPAAGSRTTNTVISGKATDNAQVTDVFWVMTNINARGITVTSNFATLATTGATTRTWSISNAVAPGTNIVAVRAGDFSGNVSPFVTRKFFNVSPSLFELAISGSGTVKGRASIAGNVPPTNGALLNIGEGYTLTATPSHGSVFVNWTSDGVPSTSPTLHFIMAPGLEIAAFFTSATAAHAEQVFNGLFYNETNGVTEKTAGMLSQLTVNATGAYSGKLLLNSASYTLAGKFDEAGEADSLIARSEADGGPVKVRMKLDQASGQIDGDVSAASPTAWTSTLFAEAADTNLTTSQYVFVLLPSTNALGRVPAGNGYLLLTNNLGQLTWRATLADGADFSKSVPPGRLGDVPLFANLHGSNGLVLGWIGISNGTARGETPLAWIKLPSSSGVFTNGFTTFLSVIASNWMNLPLQAASAATMTDANRR